MAKNSGKLEFKSIGIVVLLNNDEIKVVDINGNVGGPYPHLKNPMFFDWLFRMNKDLEEENEYYHFGIEELLQSFEHVQKQGKEDLN